MNTEANTFVVTDQMKEVRSIQLVLLKKLLEVCKRNNLRIWADSGTLIGTVREHGYIPWDDDIDMGMLRPDYDKLVEISQQEFTGRFFFQTAYSDKEYPRGHAQLRMRNTTAILPNDVDKPFHMGIFIDIFVYDVVPSDAKELETLRQQVITQKEKLFSYCDKMRFWKVFSSPVLYFRHKRIRKEHIESIRNKYVDDKDISTCPKCGSILKERTGKYGKFLGCSNYPNCKYTRDIKQNERYNVLEDDKEKFIEIIKRIILGIFGIFLIIVSIEFIINYTNSINNKTNNEINEKGN